MQCVESDCVESALGSVYSTDYGTAMELERRERAFMTVIDSNIEYLIIYIVPHHAYNISRHWS